LVVDKEDVKKKLLKDFDNSIYHTCSICGETIAKYDIENLNFEYSKSKTGEHFSHSNCIKLRGMEE
jgi:hypothetical protein